MSLIPGSNEIFAGKVNIIGDEESVAELYSELSSILGKEYLNLNDVFDILDEMVEHSNDQIVNVISCDRQTTQETQETDEIVCGICYCYELDDEIVSIKCPGYCRPGHTSTNSQKSNEINRKAVQRCVEGLFHFYCIKECFQSDRGNCPYCQQEMILKQK